MLLPFDLLAVDVELDNGAPDGKARLGEPRAQLVDGALDLSQPGALLGGERPVTLGVHQPAPLYKPRGKSGKRWRWGEPSEMPRPVPAARRHLPYGAAPKPQSYFTLAPLSLGDVATLEQHGDQWIIGALM